MPQTRNPAVVLLFVVFLIWLLLPDSSFQGQTLIFSDVVTARLARYHDALDVLNAMSWGDFAPRSPGGDDTEQVDTKPDNTRQDGTKQGETKRDNDPDKGQDTGTDTQGRGIHNVNLAGFRVDDGFAWQDLDRFREKGLRLSHHAIPPVDGQQLWDAAQGEAVWANASGTLRGEWVRRQGSVTRSFDSYNLSRSVPGMDWVGHGVEWARNITGATGRMTLRLEASRNVVVYGGENQADKASSARQDFPLSGGAIRNVKATVTVDDSAGSGFNWEMRLWGVHWPRQGVVLLTTTSEKFEGIFGLPHLTPSADFFLSSQRLLNQTLARVLEEKRTKASVDQNMPWNSDVDNAQYTAYPSPHCEFVMYAQVHPPADLYTKGQSAEEAIGAIEAELQNPLGAPIRRVPRLVMSAVVWSPDCAFFLETKGPPDFSPGLADHLVGMKTEVHTHRVKMWMLAYALVILTQVRLLKDQVKESLTPSTLGRISFWTISAMVMVDGMTFTAAATWVSSAAATFLPTLALMFASFLSMTIGGSFLHKLHETQQPVPRPSREQSNSAAEATSSATARGNQASAASGTDSILPAPVTSDGPRGSSHQQQPPIILPSDQDVAAEVADAASAVPRNNSTDGRAQQGLTFQALVGRFILVSLCLCFLAISSSTWYPRPRSMLLNFCATAYLSLWIPQIYRNAVRNCRRALTWPFVTGQSVLRLLPIAYFWLNEDNFVYGRPDRPAFIVLAGWVWVQMVVLAAQDMLGPRTGLPASWCPEAWDYHPVLRDDGLEAGGMPIGLIAAPADDDELHATAHKPQPSAKPPPGCSMRTIDCAICREALEVPVVGAGHDDGAVAGVASVFVRRLYMVTPCRHIFHTTCLEGWIKFRLQCPICRDDLPPI